MNKEEILEKSKQDNQKQDEREKAVFAQSTIYGASGMAVLFLILFLIRCFIKGGTAYDLFTMYFGYLAVSEIYKWKILKGAKERFNAIIYSFTTVIWLILYVWRG